MSTRMIIVLASAVILGVIAWRMKSTMNAAKSHFTDAELEEYRTHDVSSEAARANIPDKFRPLLEAGAAVTKLYYISMAIAACTAILLLFV